MDPLTPEFIGNTVVVMIIFYFITFAYSIYMAILNWKQSQVKDVLKETNKILLRIEKKLDKKK
jgi:hypothetical protein